MHERSGIGTTADPFAHNVAATLRSRCISRRRFRCGCTQLLFSRVMPHMVSLPVYAAQVTSLIEHERITTTMGKAKEMRRFSDQVRACSSPAPRHQLPSHLIFSQRLLFFLRAGPFLPA